MKKHEVLPFTLALVFAICSWSMFANTLRNSVWAQTPAAPEKYRQTEIQHLRLVNKNQAAQLAQVAYQNAQANLTTAYNDLIAESAKVKEENHWGKEVKFDLVDVTFCDKLGPDGKCLPEPATEKK